MRLFSLTRYFDRRFFSALGICLILLGMQTGNFIRTLTGVETVNALMILGLIFLTSFKNLIKGRFPLFYGYMNLAFLSQFVIVVYAVIAGGSKSELMNFVFLLYSIAIIFAISSNDKSVFSKFPIIVYFISSFSVLLGLCVITNGFTGIYLGDDFYNLRKEIEQDGRSMLFLYGSTAIVHIIATCSLYKFITEKGVIWVMASVPFIVADLILLFVAGKRTVILASILVILYFVWNQKFKISRILTKSTILVLFLSFLLSAVIDFDLIWGIIGGSFDSMSSGLGTFFGMQDSVYDESASIRVSLRQWALDTINNDFTIFNYVFGYGYMTKYLDQPILQSYFDMGLLGVFCYFFIIIILPIRFLLNRNNDVSLLFFKLYSIHGIVGCLTGGLPYGYRLYMSSIFLFAAYNAYKKINIKTNEESKHSYPICDF